jgi:hypothetical protein
MSLWTVEYSLLESQLGRNTLCFKLSILGIIPDEGFVDIGGIEDNRTSQDLLNLRTWVHCQ